MCVHFSAKKVECAKHQWIHLVGDQPESPHAFENFSGQRTVAFHLG